MNMVDNMAKKVTVYSLNNQKAFTENFGAKIIVLPDTLIQIFNITTNYRILTELTR